MATVFLIAGYYNEARILDPVSLDTVQVLPNMPGSVTSFLAGRTYPMEGTAVALPQHAPYTDPLTILICGGSNFGIAVDNCVSTQPEVPNPTWTIERMVGNSNPHSNSALTWNPWVAVKARDAMHRMFLHLSSDLFILY